MNVLIVDDHKSNRQIVKFILEQDGHTCFSAEDGQQAVEQFILHQPDFVLLDIVMPVMDGYEAAKLIKQHAGNKHVPIIFLTAKQDDASIIKCLESGGDDYLTKPINGIILNAKIRAHSRTLELTQQVNAKRAELAVIHAELTQEHTMGQHVLSHTLKKSLQDCANVRSYLSSMSTFNGDLLLMAEDPGGGLYVFLGDFTGHGLAAAIGAIPISQTFFTMCSKGMSAMELVSSMNKTLKSFLPEYMFCAATLVHINEQGDRAYIWTGGLPDAYLVRPGNGVIDQIKSKNMPLGILEEADFNEKIAVYDLQLGDKILLLTDGILEGYASGSSEMFGKERVVETIGDGKNDFFSKLLNNYDAFSVGVNQQDDISLVELVASPIKNALKENIQPSLMVPWEVTYKLGVEEIKSEVDPVSDIIKLLPSDFYFFRRINMIRSILSELYSNAVEHGLLGLSSEMKSKPEGFAEYYALRHSKVNDLQDGCVQITLNFDFQRKNQELLIHVEDSGQGFDFEKLKTGDLTINVCPYGRGIALIKSFSESVKYSKNGACVDVSFSLNQSDRIGKYQLVDQA